MATLPINLAILTSSRADFGIYLPLLKRLRADDSIHFKLIVFGTHLSKYHGYTIESIRAEGFSPDYVIDSLLTGDTPEAIATSMSVTMMKFAQFWGNHRNEFELVICLGDRYEMFAAVSAGAPFGIKFAHLHGGEQTLGAIDNFFRHSISHNSWCHFVSTEQYAQRLREMIDVKERIYNVGALSLDSIQQIPILSVEDIQQRWHVDVAHPTILITFHPETVASRNEMYAHELVNTFKILTDFQLIITMPNADTYGAEVRRIFEHDLRGLPHVMMVENFGTAGYFSMMHYASFLLGNTSSGIIEAASFGKYVINIGDRQKGRLQSPNVIDTPIFSTQILDAVKEVKLKGHYTGENIYFQHGAADKIHHIIKSLLT